MKRRKGVVSILDKFPGICYNRLWTCCLLGGGDMGRMVIEVPEELTELGKAMAEQLAEVQRTMARQSGGKAVDYALVEQAVGRRRGGLSGRRTALSCRVSILTFPQW